METNAIVRLMGLWYIAVYKDGVMQYSVYGGYKREQDAIRIATRKGLTIDRVIR